MNLFSKNLKELEISLKEHLSSKGVLNSGGKQYYNTWHISDILGASIQLAIKKPIKRFEYL